MASPNSEYTLNMYTFKTKSPPSDQDHEYDHHPLSSPSLATLEIRMTQRYIIQLRACTDDDPDHHNDIVCDIDDVLSPWFSHSVAVPPHVLALQTLREECVAGALGRIFNADGEVGRALRRDIESYMAAAAETMGFLEFAVVAEVYLTTIDVIDPLQASGSLGLLVN